MFKVKDKCSGQVLTVFGVSREEHVTMFLVCLQGQWAWVQANRFRPEED